MYLRELSGSKFHSVTSSNVILYNDVKNSIFIKSGFIRFWKWALHICTHDYCIDCVYIFNKTYNKKKNILWNQVTPWVYQLTSCSTVSLAFLVFSCSRFSCCDSLLTSASLRAPSFFCLRRSSFCALRRIKIFEMHGYHEKNSKKLGCKYKKKHSICSQDSCLIIAHYIDLPGLF